MRIAFNSRYVTSCQPWGIPHGWHSALRLTRGANAPQLKRITHPPGGSVRPPDTSRLDCLAERAAVIGTVDPLGHSGVIAIFGSHLTP